MSDLSRSHRTGFMDNSSTAISSADDKIASAFEFQQTCVTTGLRHTTPKSRPTTNPMNNQIDTARNNSVSISYPSPSLTQQHPTSCADQFRVLIPYPHLAHASLPLDLLGLCIHVKGKKKKKKTTYICIPFSWVYHSRPSIPSHVHLPPGGYEFI